MGRNIAMACPRLLRAAGALALASGMLAGPARAALTDLNVNDPNPPACVGGATNSETFDDGETVNEQILALTDPSGANVFWELGFNALGSTVSCTQTPATGFATGFSCDNGLSIDLPPGATETTSVASTQPVNVSATPLAGAGTATFSLTATLDGGSFPSCQNFYEVEALEPQEAFDLVFVLDRSGSMGTAAAGGTRWDALATGVLSFLPFIQTAAEPPTPAGSRFGLTFFDTTVDAALTTPMFDILTSGSPSTDFTNVPGRLTEPPSGATAMGLGLQDAFAKTTDASRPRVVVLFSDGEQNVNPMVDLDGCSFSNPASDINPPDCPATSGHKIVATGIGSPSGSYLDTLESLGANNRGTSLITDNGSDFTGDGAVPGDIGGTFQSAIGAALQGNSPQEIAFFTGALQPDPQVPRPLVLPAFDVNEKVDRLLLSLTLSSRFETPQLLRFLSGISIERDGTDVTSQFRPMVFGNFSNVLTLAANATGSEGEETPLDGSYVVTLTLLEGFDPDLEYRLVPYAEDRRLEASSQLNASVVPVNGTIDVSVRLGWLNRGIEDATLVVRAFGPGADMGETLSPGDPVDLQGGDDAANAGIQKYDQLAADDPDFLAKLALSPNAIAMTHQGDGVYTGSYPVPDNVGVVHFVYDVAADSPLFGRVQRHWYESAYARFDSIDMAASDLASAFVDGGLVLTFTPKRPGGKLLGPGYLSGFSFDGATVQEGRDLQNGTYSFVLDDDNPDVPITVSLLDDEIYSGPAGWGEGPKRSVFALLPIWLWIVIALLVLLILLLLYRRSRTSGP